MPKKISIGNQEFASKKEAQDFIRSIRDRYGDGQRIIATDEEFLRELVMRHPEVSAKIGVGIDHFTVGRDSEFGTTRCFYIHRVDGSSTDVSFKSCLDGRNARYDRHEALRRAVQDQVIHFRNQAFGSGAVRCAMTGVELEISGCHVDHEPPLTFLRLVDDWLKQVGITLDMVLITPPADNQIVTHMIDPVQRDSWAAFHQSAARLRILSPSANLGLARRKTA